MAPHRFRSGLRDWQAGGGLLLPLSRTRPRRMRPYAARGRVLIFGARRRPPMYPGGGAAQPDYLLTCDLSNREKNKEEGRQLTYGDTGSCSRPNQPC